MLGQSRRTARLLLAFAAGGFVLVAALVWIDGPAFLARRAGLLGILAIEFALLNVVLSPRPGFARIGRVALVLVPLVVALGARAYLGLRVHDFLEWDEVYYLSIAVTGAAGRGLYAFVFGYGPMPIMGGVGYLAYLYAATVYLVGPSIIALRIVSQAASVGGLVAMFYLLRSLYGSGTAWMGAAFSASLALFMMAGTARMDGFTFAAVTCGLLAVVKAFEQPGRWTGHLVAGLVFGLGLQAHVDTVATAIGCGLFYLIAWMRAMKVERGYRHPSALLAYAAGWGIGLLVFVGFNILPDPLDFYRTTVQVRLDATSWYSGGTSSLAGSFLDPRILFAKEAERYRLLSRAVPVFESVVGLVAIVVLLVRRNAADRFVAIVLAGVLIASAIVLNNASPLYYIHVLPALAMPLAPLFTHGLRRASRISLQQVGFGSLLAFALVGSLLSATSSARTVGRLRPTINTQAADEAFAARARAAADPRCTVAGDAGLYVRRFPDYPYFISSRPAEVAYGMLFYGTTSEADYWEIKAPGAIFWPYPLSDGLSAYVSRHGLTEVGAGVWVDRRRCGPPGS